MRCPLAVGGQRSVQTDAVLQASEAGLPVLFVEADDGTEAPEVVVQKLEGYLRYFRLTVKDASGVDVPVWERRYALSGREGHPPVALVFASRRLSPQALMRRIQGVKDASVHVWAGRYQRMSTYSDGQDGYRDYDDAIPVLAITLEQLRAYGSHEAPWWRFGHRRQEFLHTALANPDDHSAYEVRDEDRRRRRAEERERQRRQEQVEFEAWRAGEEAEEARRVREKAERRPVPPCEMCGRPLDAPAILPPGYEVPPEDGKHCLDCRYMIDQREPGLLEALGLKRRGREER